LRLSEHLTFSGDAGVSFASVDDGVRTALALFQAKRGTDVESIFETGLLRVMQNAVEHILRAFQVAVGAETDADLGLLGAMRLHQRKNLFGNASAALIRRVQQMVGLVAANLPEELCIALGNENIVLRLVKLQHLVCLVEAFGAKSARIAGRGNRLAGSAHASSGTGHYFDQVVVALPSRNLLSHNPGVPQAVNNGELQFCSINGDLRFAQPRLTTNFFKLQAVELLSAGLLDGVAKDGFHHTTGVAEYHSGAGVEPEWHVEGFGLKRVEDQTGRLDHVCQFLRGQHVIDIRIA